MDEWYNNKEIFEMLQEIKKDMADLRKEMLETRTIIRDYNNLREKLDNTEKKMYNIEGDIAGTFRAAKLIATFISVSVGVISVLVSIFLH